jgi:hypothetical protein
METCFWHPQFDRHVWEYQQLAALYPSAELCQELFPMIEVDLAAAAASCAAFFAKESEKLLEKHAKAAPKERKGAQAKSGEELEEQKQAEARNQSQQTGKGRVLKVGYISASLHNHPIGYLLGGIFDAHTSSHMVGGRQVSRTKDDSTGNEAHDEGLPARLGIRVKPYIYCAGSSCKRTNEGNVQALTALSGVAFKNMSGTSGFASSHMGKAHAAPPPLVKLTPLPRLCFGGRISQT